MNCKEVNSKLTDYIFGNLNKEQKKEIERHLQDCKLCRSDYQYLQKVYSVMEIEKQSEASPFLPTRVLQAIEQKPVTIFEQLFMRYKLIVSVLVIFLGLLIGLWLSSIIAKPVRTNIDMYNNDEVFYLTSIEQTENQLVYYPLQ